MNSKGWAVKEIIHKELKIKDTLQKDMGAKEISKIMNLKIKKINKMQMEYLKDFKSMVKISIDLRKKEKENYKWHKWEEMQ